MVLNYMTTASYLTQKVNMIYSFPIEVLKLQKPSYRLSYPNVRSYNNPIKEGISVVTLKMLLHSLSKGIIILLLFFLNLCTTTLANIRVYSKKLRN